MIVYVLLSAPTCTSTVSALAPSASGSGDEATPLDRLVVPSSRMPVAAADVTVTVVCCTITDVLMSYAVVPASKLHGTGADSAIATAGPVHVICTPL